MAAQTIYDLINAPATWIVLGIWFLICILYTTKRDPFLARSWDLMSKSIIFKIDAHPLSYRFYAREQLEDIAGGILAALKTPFNGIVAQFKEWIQGQVNIVYRKDRPMRILGYFIYLAFFIAFVWADSISIVNTLATLNLLSGGVPDWLGRWELAVGMGSLGAAVVAGLIAMDIHDEQSILSLWEEHKGAYKNFGQAAIRIIAVIAAIVVLFFGIQRLTVMQPVYTSSDTVKLLVDTVVTIGVPLNTVLTTTLIALEGIMGIFLLVIVVQVALLGVIIAINYIMSGLAYLLPWLLDTIYRSILIILDLFFYIIATPWQWLGNLISAPFRPKKG